MRLIRLNTVVLPAPLGPISVNTSPRLHVEAHVVDGQHAAEAHAQVLRERRTSLI
jgi:hypothetical protein